MSCFPSSSDVFPSSMSHPVDENKRLFGEKETKQQKLALQSSCAVAVCWWIWKHLSSLSRGVPSIPGLNCCSVCMRRARLPPLAQGGCVSHERHLAGMKIFPACRGAADCASRAGEMFPGVCWEAWALQGCRIRLVSSGTA